MKVKLYKKGTLILEKVKKEDGVIITPEEDRELPQIGLVVDCLGCDSIKKRDKVVYVPYGPSEVKIDDKVYLLADERDILAKIED